MLINVRTEAIVTITAIHVGQLDGGRSGISLHLGVNAVVNHRAVQHRLRFNNE